MVLPGVLVCPLYISHLTQCHDRYSASIFDDVTTNQRHYGVGYTVSQGDKSNLPDSNATTDERLENVTFHAMRITAEFYLISFTVLTVIAMFHL